MGKTKNNKTKKLNKLLLFVSIVLLLSSILITTFSVMRLIMWIGSIILLSLNIKSTYLYTVSKTIIIFIFMLLVSIILDGIIVFTFNKIPVFTYNILKLNETIVYNSLGMRVWQCDQNNYKDIIVDPFYEKGYMCSPDNIETIDINTFLNTVVDNHNEYKNKFVKIKGKISKKSGLNSIEMRFYEKTDNQVNGYVEFADNITLKVLFNKEETLLDSYDVYDEITIIGVVKNIENDNLNHIVYMTGTKVVSTQNLKEYTLTTTEEQKCSQIPTLVHTSEEFKLYKYCLNDIIVTYPEGQYEIESALSSSKLDIKDISNGSISSEKNSENNTMIHRFEDYSILICDSELSNQIFIGPKNMKFTTIECKKSEEE